MEDDYHPRAQSRGHGISLYRPSDSPLSSAEYSKRNCSKRSFSSSLQRARAKVICVPHTPWQAFGAIPTSAPMWRHVAPMSRVLNPVLTFVWPRSKVLEVVPG